MFSRITSSSFSVICVVLFLFSVSGVSFASNIPDGVGPGDLPEEAGNGRGIDVIGAISPPPSDVSGQDLADDIHEALGLTIPAGPPEDAGSGSGELPDAANGGLGMFVLEQLEGDLSGQELADAIRAELEIDAFQDTGIFEAGSITDGAPSNVSITPEPATLSLLTLGGLALLRKKK